MRSSRRLRTTLVLANAVLAIGFLSGVTGTAASAAPTGRSVTRHAATPALSSTVRVLFDDTKAETAGNADWIISTSMPDPLGQDSSPQTETDWTGALSSWGVALQKTGGYSLKTLSTGSITYGTGGALDLSKFDVFVLPEPNVALSSAEKTAVMTFVQNGGGLFLITDHNGSDRNNDGIDSVGVANDLMSNNSVDSTDPFGFAVDVKNITSDTPQAISDGSDPVLHGPFGAVSTSSINSGTTQTLHPSDNPAVKGLVYQSTATPGGNTGSFFATSSFGTGRVAVWGDSSTIDDGTGQSGNTLYDGWNTASNAALALNATAWLGGGSGGGGGTGGCTAAQLIGNPGFETGSAAPWSASTSVIYGGSAELARTGSYVAWLDGYGTAHTDTLSQSVTIPSGCTNATFSFYLHVDTDETGASAWDDLTLAVLNSSGSVLATPATYSNLNAASGYQQHSVNLAGYAGQSITLRFTGTEGSKLQTSFVIDDAALNVS